MAANFLEKLFEHNNWANLKTIEACSALSDEQLDAEPRSATRGTLRRTLVHLVGSQQHYLALLTGLAPRFEWQASPALDVLQQAALVSGEGLLALARDGLDSSRPAKLTTDDGYEVEPWVLMVQVLQHATEHREQINSMLSALGLAPLELDGWTFGEVSGALVPAASRKALLVEQLRRGHQERQAWVEGLSAAERDEQGSAGRWSARDYVAHIAFWQSRWADQLAAARRGEALPAEDLSDAAEDLVNARVFEERHGLAWPEVLADAERAYQAMLAQAEECSVEELFGPRYGAALGMATAGQRLGVAGCWHIFMHEAQFYLERGSVARAGEINKAAADTRMALASGTRDRALALYNLACFYATTGQPQEALARLPEALRLMPGLAEYAQHDSDMDALRGDPAYQALFQP